MANSKATIVAWFFALGLCVHLLACSHRDQSNPHFKRGTDWLELGRYDEARQEFQQAIVEEPKNADARYQIARSHFLQRNYQQAVTRAQDALEVRPGHSGAQKLIQDVVAANRSLLQNKNDHDRANGLDLLFTLVNAKLVDFNDFKELIAPLLSSDSDVVANSAFAILKSHGLEAVGLSNLAANENRTFRARALTLIQRNFTPGYLPILRTFLNDRDSAFREQAALLLLEKANDRAAKETLSRIYHEVLQREIAIGKSPSSGIGLEFNDRIRQIAMISPVLNDPTFAGDLAELVCVGRVYGFLAQDLRSAVDRIGNPGRPFVDAVLSKEPEYRALLQRKGFSDKSQIDWRFRWYR